GAVDPADPVGHRGNEHLTDGERGCDPGSLINSCMQGAADIGKAEGGKSSVQCGDAGTEQHAHQPQPRNACGLDLKRRRHFLDCRRIRLAHRCALEWVLTRATTDMPGRSRSVSPSASSMMILTAMRCTTFVKFPVALSGGRSANCAPEPGATASTWPCIRRPGKASTVMSASSPTAMCVNCVSL